MGGTVGDNGEGVRLAERLDHLGDEAACADGRGEPLSVGAAEAGQVDRDMEERGGRFVGEREVLHAERDQLWAALQHLGEVLVHLRAIG